MADSIYSLAFLMFETATNQRAGSGSKLKGKADGKERHDIMVITNSQARRRAVTRHRD